MIASCVWPCSIPSSDWRYANAFMPDQKTTGQPSASFQQNFSLSLQQHPPAGLKERYPAWLVLRAVTSEPGVFPSFHTPIHTPNCTLLGRPRRTYQSRYGASAQRTLRPLVHGRCGGRVLCVRGNCVQLLPRSRLALVRCGLCWAVLDGVSHPREI
jgi:hypothetical protein